MLAAGSLGSTEILLRSKAKGLPTSDQLGKRFTGNGDVLGFAYNCDEAVHGIGLGTKIDQQAPGPCITSVIDLRQQAELDDGMVIEEGSIPGGMARFLPLMLATAASLTGKDTDSGVIDFIREQQRILDSAIRSPYAGATEHTQTFLVMTHDQSNGVMSPKDDAIRIDWPGVGTDGARGAVDHLGVVYSGAGTEVHAGLHVLDCAIIPRSIGINPLFTISALAERGIGKIAQARGWKSFATSARTLRARCIPRMPPCLSEAEPLRPTVSHGKNGHIDCIFGKNAVVDVYPTILAHLEKRA
ncbi:MAG: cholesterol oxidase [Kiritimatiellia bacterium]